MNNRKTVIENYLHSEIARTLVTELIGLITGFHVESYYAFEV